MKLTPLDVRHQEFPDRFGGYQKAAVRDFLTSVSEQMEALLGEGQDLRDDIVALRAQLEERRANEDEIRRAVVSAERISHDLRENARREAELTVQEAHAQRETLIRDAEARASTVEAQHRARLAELEAAYRDRQLRLERSYHDLQLERDRAQAERLAVLEKEFSERHGELSQRLSAAQGEYVQFVTWYQRLMSTYAELSAKHLTPLGSEPGLAAPPLPQTEPLPLTEPLPQTEPLPPSEGPAPDTMPALPTSPLTGLSASDAAAIPSEIMSSPDSEVPAVQPPNLSEHLRRLWGLPDPSNAQNSAQSPVSSAQPAQDDREPARVEGQQFL